jgi:thiosulfate reductase cytochrome b subunit
MAAEMAATTGLRTRAVHPLWLRVMHWTNAVAFSVMLASGWRIYNASPLFDFKFPAWITLGGWLAGALQWHFAAMWVLAINGVLYLAWAIASGRLARRLLPIAPRRLLGDVQQALRGKLAHDDPARYNDVQKLAYLAAIALLIVIVLSGLAIWKPVQFPLLRELMGDYDNARIVHFYAMAGLGAFVVVHVVMATLVPKTIVAMLRGR